jgi:hypothetical protein
MNNATQASLNVLQSRIGSANWQNWSALRWCFYDYVGYPTAGGLQLQFFTNANGSTDPTLSNVKTKEYTNCPKARSFGQVYFVIQEIRTHLRLRTKDRQPTGINNDASLIFKDIAASMSKINEIMRRGVLNITLGQKSYFDILNPLINAPPGFGLEFTNWGGSYTATAPPLWVQQNPDIRHVHTLSPPQLIEPDQTIDATLDFPTTSPVLTNLVSGSYSLYVDIGLILDGYIARPAQ